jgi:uncharacterized membrane protein
MTVYSEALPSSPAKGRVMLARFGDRRLMVAIALYLVVFGTLAAWRWHIGTYGADMGLFTQVVSDGFGGFRDGPEDGTHFRFHWSPLLALLWPLVAATHLPLVLQFVQLALIAATAIPLYLLARTYLPEKLGLAVACLALAYPPLMAVAFTEFHEIAFYPPIAVGLFWAADRAAWRWFAVFAFASALIRDDTCIVFAIVGLVFAAIGVLRRGTQTVGDDGLLVGTPRQPRTLVVAGVALAFVNVAAPLVYFGLVIPRVGAWQPSHFYDYPFASSPLGLLAALFVHPAYVAYLLNYGRLTYLIEAFAPLALLPFFSRWSLLALPGLGIVLLSSSWIAWRMGSHYAAIFVPWLLIGALAALVRWHRAGRALRVRRFLTAAFAICAVVLVAFNPLHPLHYIRPVYPWGDDIGQALASIPASAHVLTHDEWFTWIALTHPHATVFLCPDVDMLVLGDGYPTSLWPEVHAELESGQLRLARRFGRVTVYLRRADRPGEYEQCATGRYSDFPSRRAFLDFNLKRMESTRR